MAERRMFAKSIVLSDAFLDMPLSARCLYFTLGMLADDDGFVGNPRSVMRQCGASQDDMSILLQKRYVLGFESGVIVIKHWRMNNYLRTDRYHTTTYIEEKENLVIDKKGAYTEKDKNKAITDVGIPSGNQVVDGRYTEVSIGKDSIGKVNNKKNTAFVKPTLDEVKNYCLERNNSVDPESFIDFYESKGWLIGKNHMKDWKAAVRTWEKRNKGESNDRVLGTDTSRDEAEYERQVREQLKRIESGEFDNENLWE